MKKDFTNSIKHVKDTILDKTCEGILWYSGNLKKYAPQSLGGVVTTFPFMVGNEVFFSGYSDMQSLGARVVGVGMTTTVLPPLMAVRDKKREKMSLEGKAEEEIRKTEGNMTAKTTLVTLGIMYGVTGDDLVQSGVAVVGGSLILKYIAPKLFRLVDNYKFALLNTPISRPYEFLSSASKKAKLGFVIGYTALSAAVSFAQYMGPNVGVQDWFPDVKEKVLEVKDALFAKNTYVVK